MKVYENNHTYDFAFPAVTLAYFLRYPNPYSTHVLATDVIERRFDPETQRLYSTRLHLKRSKVPKAALALLPRSLLGASADGESKSYILETSVVDIKEGWMDTESRNLNHVGVLSVVERQVFRRPSEIIPRNIEYEPALGYEDLTSGRGVPIRRPHDSTDVKATVTFVSRLGAKMRQRRAQRMQEAREAREAAQAETDDEDENEGFFQRWSYGSVRSTIESVGLNRAASKSQPNATEGMKVVLERMRQGGIIAVLEGMQRDRETIFGQEPWQHRQVGVDKTGHLDIDISDH